MTLELEARRRRAIYRAAHRGTREMDWLLGRYAAATVGSMGADELDRFEQVLAQPDPDLNAWILDPAPLGTSDMRPDIEAIRRFHAIA
jgi:antitoxin CptB